MTECQERTTLEINEGDSVTLRGQIVDAKKKPIAKASIDTVELTLFDQDSGSIINSRDSQDVKDANGGTLTDTLAIAGISQTSPAILTFTAEHDLREGDRVHITGVVGMTELNGRLFKVSPLADDSVTLQGEDARDHTAYSSGGVARIGLLTVDLKPGDSPIVSSTLAIGDTEEHRAMIDIGYSGDESLAIEYVLEVENLAKKG